jgi:excisionase family DNA binding protein
MTSLAFDRKKLAINTVPALSQFDAGRKLTRHDGQEYAIAHGADAAVPMPMSRTLMTLQEVAEYLRVTRSTIHQLLKRNQIPAFRIGRHWRFNLEEIENWCSSRELTADPKADD